MFKGLFIAATDTGVGKTVVGAALAQYFRGMGRVVRVRKPVESGCACSPTGLLPADALVLQRAAGNLERLPQICPWPLALPLSPERAAQAVGLQLSLDALTVACRAGVGDNDVLLVEGAGGFFSPLASGVRNAELAVALGLPILLVVPDRLGCLNHAMLTAEAITARGLRMAAVVLNRCGASPVPEMDNAADLSRWLGQAVYPLALLPPHEQPVATRLQAALPRELCAVLSTGVIAERPHNG